VDKELQEAIDELVKQGNRVAFFSKGEKIYDSEEEIEC